MKITTSILVTGYNDRNDGPSIFISNLTTNLSKEYSVRLVSNKFTYRDFIFLLRADALILNSCNLMPLLILLMWPLISRKRIISVIHGEMGNSIKFSIKNILLKLCEKKMLSLAHSVVFVSEVQLKNFCKLYPSTQLSNKSFVIPNGISVNPILANEKEKIIVYAGGENTSKGRHLLDDVIRQLSYSPILQGYSIILFGMNIEYDIIVNNVRVIAKSKVRHSVVLEFLSKSEIFLSLSPYETFGIACAEAFVLSNKVVCYENSGFLEVVKTNCYIAYKYDSSKFSELVENAIKSKLKSITEDVESLSVEKMVRSYIKLLHK